MVNFLPFDARPYFFHGSQNDNYGLKRTHFKCFILIKTLTNLLKSNKLWFLVQWNIWLSMLYVCTYSLIIGSKFLKIYIPVCCLHFRIKILWNKNEFCCPKLYGLVHFWGIVFIAYLYVLKITVERKQSHQQRWPKFFLPPTCDKLLQTIL